MNPPISIDGQLAEGLEEIGVEFLADFFGAVVERFPSNLDALSELAQVLTALKRYPEGLAVDERLAKAMPEDAMVHYNLACSLCLTGRALESITALERSIELGYDDPEHMVTDDDLTGLRGDPRFQAIAKRLFQATS